MALIDLQNELAGMLPGLSPQLAKTYINRALDGIYRERNWSFLMADAAVVCPAQIDDGTASITQYLDTVTLDATASAAIAGQLGASAVPGLRRMQFRPTSTPPPAAGQIYNILDYDDAIPAAVVLTLDRPLMEATDAAATYRVYRCYVTPPVADFLKWESLVDMANAITLTGNRLTATSADFDRMDPQRTAAGLSYHLGSYRANQSDGAGGTTPQSQSGNFTAIYEFWPQPLTGQTWYARYRRMGQPLSEPDDEQPDIICDAAIMAKALYQFAYPFAAANVANFPAFKGANWPTLILAARSDYIKELNEAKRQDNERQLQDVWNRGHGLRTPRGFGRYDVPGYPIDANFLQSHLIRW